MFLSRKESEAPINVQQLVNEWFDQFQTKYGFIRDNIDIKASTPGRYMVKLQNGPTTPEQVLLPQIGLLVDTDDNRCVLSVYKRPRSSFYVVVLSHMDIIEDQQRCRNAGRKIKSKKMQKKVNELVSELEKENIDPGEQVKLLELKLKELRQAIKDTTCKIQAARVLVNGNQTQ